MAASRLKCNALALTAHTPASAAAHSGGCACSVKPGNIFLNLDEQQNVAAAYLGDWGLARMTAVHQQRARAGLGNGGMLHTASPSMLNNAVLSVCAQHRAWQQSYLPMNLA